MENTGMLNDDIDILKPVTSGCRLSRKKDENDGSERAGIIDDHWPKQASSDLRVYFLRSFGHEVGPVSKWKPGSGVVYSIE